MTDSSNPITDLLTVIPVTALTNADPSKMLRGVTARHGFNLVNGDTDALHHEALAELFEYVREQPNGGALLPDLNNRLNSMVTSVFPVVCTVNDGKIRVHVHALDGQDVADEVSLIMEAQRWACAEIVIDTIVTDVTGQLSNQHGNAYWQLRPVLPVNTPNKTYPAMMQAITGLNEVLVMHLMREGLSLLSGTPLLEMQRKVNRAAFAVLGADLRSRHEVIGNAFLDKTNAMMGLFGQHYRRTY